MEQGREYGGFWIRLLALAADIAIVFVASIVVVIAASFLGRIGPKVASIVLLVLPSVYWPLMHASARQATYGKPMLGLKVPDLDGNRISLLPSFGRAIAWMSPFPPLGPGFLMAGFHLGK